MTKKKKKSTRIPKSWKRKRRKLFTLFIFLFFLVAIVGFFAIRGKWFATGESDAKKVIPELYNQALLVSVGKKALSVTPMDGNPVKVVQKDVRYIYEGAYKNTDVIQTNYPYKIKEELIFYDKGHPLEFRYKLGNLENFVVEKDQEGNIVFYDKEKYAGEKELARIFTIPAPFIEDKITKRSFSAVKSEIQGDILTISINPEWMSEAAYPVILDPTIEINVLNVYSHPSSGEDWVVEFITKGKADLRIIPQDQATIDDDEFVGLYCDANIHEAQILAGDTIYYPNWECNGTGKVIHKTLKAGHHTLKFEFSGLDGYAEDWAYNSPGGPWFDTGWGYRKEITISYTGSENLSEYQVLLDNLDTATMVGDNKLQSNCNDLRFTNESGTLLSYWIVGSTCNTAATKIWIKIDSVPAANVIIYMYYGNASAASYQSESDTFSYTSEKTVAYVLDSTVNDLQVISLEANNSISHNGTTLTLGQYATSSFSSISQFGTITAKKLFNAADVSADTDLIVPVSWAGTEFLIYSRTAANSLDFFMIAPWGDSTVTIYTGGADTGCGTTVTSSGTTVTSCTTTNVAIRVTATNPIVLFYDDKNTDPMPVHPVTTQKWLGGGSTAKIVNGSSTLDYNYISASVSSAYNPANLAANGSATLSGTGGYGAGAVLVWADAANYSFGINQEGDGAGNDAHYFNDETEQGTRFGSASGVNYISIASTQDATCSVYYAETGTLILSTQATSSNTQIYFDGFKVGTGTSFVAADWYMTCDKAVMAHIDKSAGGDESSLMSYPMMRQFTYPTPSAGAPGTEEEAVMSTIRVKGGTRIKGGTRLNLEDSQEPI